MKKLLTIVMVAVLALSLVACGGAKAASAAPAPASSAPASSAAPVESTPAESTPAESAPAAVGNEWGLTEGYMGMSSANEAVCIGFNEDWSLAVFVAMGEDGEYASFVGPAVDNGDGTVTITDETNELALTFGVTELENGNLELDLGDLGTAEVAACDVDEVVKTMQEIDAAGTAVA